MITTEQAQKELLEAQASLTSFHNEMSLEDYIAMGSATTVSALTNQMTHAALISNITKAKQLLLKSM
jgi:hypothetical protein